MLKSLGIQNFQSHVETFVEFCKGFNVIVGASDHGKSSLLRSIGWVVKNRPSGDDIKNWDAGKNDTVCVELAFENPITGAEETVSKERKGSTSFYTLSTLPDPLSVVGRDVPSEVSKLINFSELNFKGQHDDYLFKMTPGAVAKMINDLVGLSIIDISLKNLNSQAMSLKRDCDRLTEEIKKKNEEIESMSYLEAMGQDIKEIETFQIELDSVTNKTEQLSKTIEGIQFIQKEINKNNAVLEMSTAAKEINSILVQLKTTEQTIASLSSLVSSISSISEQLNIEKQLLKAKDPVGEINGLILDLKDKERKIFSLLSSITSIEEISADLEIEKQWLEVKNPCREILDLIHSLNEIDQKKTKIENAISSHLKLEEQNKKASADVIKRTKDLEGFLEKMMICPTCGQMINKATISSMIGKVK